MVTLLIRSTAVLIASSSHGKIDSAPIAHVAVRRAVKCPQPLPHDISAGQRDEHHAHGGNPARQSQPRPPQPRPIIRNVPAAASVIAATRRRHRAACARAPCDRSASLECKSPSLKFRCHPEAIVVRRVPHFSRVLCARSGDFPRKPTPTCKLNRRPQTNHHRRTHHRQTAHRPKSPATAKPNHHRGRAALQGPRNPSLFNSGFSPVVVQCDVPVGGSVCIT